MILANVRSNTKSAISSLAPKRQNRLAVARLLVIVTAGFAVPECALAQDSARATAKTQLAAANGWTYQLQGLDLEVAAQEAADVLVTDHSIDGTAEQILASGEVAALKLKPDGSRRLVVAYMSIGEAESYRFYWNRKWAAGMRAAASPGNPDAQVPEFDVADTCATSDCSNDAAATAVQLKAGSPMREQAPNWLHLENAQWAGNYYVRFWQPEWQNIIFGRPDSYLDRIIEAGFDGVYLDRADIYAYWEATRSSSEDDMIEFVVRLSAYAKARNPEFLVILQNAEELASRPAVRTAIDSVAKEDLLYGIDHTETANRPNEVAASLRHLKRAQANGLPIFVVEYLSDARRIEKARTRLQDLGFVSTFASRELGSLIE